MTINKAREIQALNIKLAANSMPPDVKTALIMSTDALSKIQEYRRLEDRPSYYPLEGETGQ